ncbi:nitroreductase family protein [Candidatus Poriferisocius sp.]|uniref:nitroreductase family protein n=1 Tax=Candidatus Poriferisocius sp. TaxID=3101276 RepID=UPI003B592022
MANLHLSADEVLTTTRAVRRRLDTSRPVAPELINECLDIAVQAPTGSNRQNWRFMVVTEPDLIAALAELYRRARDVVGDHLSVLPRLDGADPSRLEADDEKMHASAGHLFDHIHEVPGMLIPCLMGRVWGHHPVTVASHVGSVIQAVWSFMLAARERGIGTVWTTIHLCYEEEAAELLGIPYDEVMQVALIPFAHTIGTDFRPARREPLELVTRWNHW